MKKRGRPFHKVGALHPGRSVFNLSYEKKFTTDMGILYPVMCDEVVPGDYFVIGNKALVRMQPLVAPIMHEISISTHYFFVPYRLLWDKWEDFITGGVDGTYGDPGTDDEPLPKWIPKGKVGTNLVPYYGGNTPDRYVIWDSVNFPYPTWLPGTGSGSERIATRPSDIARELYMQDTIFHALGFPSPIGFQAHALPMSFPRDAYNFIWNEYYRDENLQDEVPRTNDLLLRRNWTKDYFTSALPDTQRGTQPALPVTAKTVFAIPPGPAGATGDVPGFLSPIYPPPGTYSYSIVNSGSSTVAANNNIANTFNTTLNNNNTVTGFSADISDLRLAFQIQKFLERNMRAGVRYTEFLRARYGVAPRDERLDRPEYIGGTKSPLIISEVLQTSATDDTTTPQANMAGHGISINHSLAGKYKVKEFGLIMGLMSVMPAPSYQQGINKQWLHNTRYDFIVPEFVNLSEVSIDRNELVSNPFALLGGQGQAQYADTFISQGFQPIYDEARYKPNLVSGYMRHYFSYWHLGRIFEIGTGSYVGNIPFETAWPRLNSDFITCKPRKDIFAVQKQEFPPGSGNMIDVPGLIISFGNIIKAFRPIPPIGEPGLVDHH